MIKNQCIHYSEKIYYHCENDNMTICAKCFEIHYGHSVCVLAEKFFVDNFKQNLLTNSDIFQKCLKKIYEYFDFISKHCDPKLFPEKNNILKHFSSKINPIVKLLENVPNATEILNKIQRQSTFIIGKENAILKIDNTEYKKNLNDYEITTQMINITQNCKEGLMKYTELCNNPDRISHSFIFLHNPTCRIELMDVKTGTPVSLSLPIYKFMDSSQFVLISNNFYYFPDGKNKLLFANLQSGFTEMFPISKYKKLLMNHTMISLNSNFIYLIDAMEKDLIFSNKVNLKYDIFHDKFMKLQNLTLFNYFKISIIPIKQRYIYAFHEIENIGIRLMRNLDGNF